MRWWVMGAALAVACSDGGGKDDGSSAAPILACDDSENDGDCVFFSGAGWTEQDAANECATGTLLAECPNGGIGECVIDGGSDFETVSTFYPGFWNTAGASAACFGQGGDWSQL